MGKDTTNLSKLRREKLLTAIKEIKEDITDPDKITALNEIENELLEMKYGLKWEKHEEQVDRDLLTKIPVFKEDKEREIVKTEGEFNFLLEGDNLHSLMLLEKTHRRGIDLIVTDPPYNRGSNDFKYGDKTVDLEDDYKHSKWLSFMNRRLEIAHELLSDEGVIFINIDDNEHANLKLLMDRIFGEQNFIGNISWHKGYGKNDSKFMRNITEYILVYARNYSYLNSKKLYFRGEKDGLIEVENIRNDYLRDKKSDHAELEKEIKKYYKENKHLKGITSYNKVEEKTLRIYSSVTLENPSTPIYFYEVIHPTTNKVCKMPNKGWNRPRSSMDELLKNNEVLFGKTEQTTPRRKYYLDEMRTESPKDLILNSDQGGSEIINILGGGIFDFPKPTSLIKQLSKLYPNKNATILDFFAGSGTTGHAVLELNKEDGGNRKFILCTNNEVGEAKEKEFKKLHGDKEGHPEEWATWEEEHGIARSVTYKRLEKVINGYTTPKGKDVEGIPANLKYYKTEYIPRELEDDDYDAHDEINKYIIELIQLEFAIDIHNPKIGLVLSDEYMESDHFNVKEIDDKKLDEVEDIYIAEGLILPDGLQEKISKRGIRLHWVPQYYKF